MSKDPVDRALRDLKPGPSHRWPQGRSVWLPFDIRVGWQWTGTQGYTSRTSACVAVRHPRDSITWTWAIYASKPRGAPWWRWRFSLETQPKLKAQP